MGELKYNIVDEYETSDIEGHKKYYVKETDTTRERSFFTYLPLLVGNKLRWLKRVNVIETMFLVKSLDFDEFNYTHSWSDYKEEWRITEILN